VTEAVNDVIAQRAHDPRGLERTLTASLAIHVGIVVLFGVVLRSWLAAPGGTPAMMTISLGVSAGPRSTGMTAIGAKAVDRIDKPRTPEPVALATPPREVAINVAPDTTPRRAESPPASRTTTGTERKTRGRKGHRHARRDFERQLPS